MSKKDEALKLALEALKMCRGVIRNNIENLVPIESPNPWFSQDVDHAITAIREALAEQPAQQGPGRNHWEDGDVFERIGVMKKQPARQGQRAKDDADIYEFWARNKEAEQPAQQEPVAHKITGKLGDICSFRGGTNVKKGDLVYTSPPASKPLTDEEIKRRKPISADFVSFRAGVRCMEREYRIGEKR